MIVRISSKQAMHKGHFQGVLRYCHYNTNSLKQQAERVEAIDTRSLKGGKTAREVSQILERRSSQSPPALEASSTSAASLRLSPRMLNYNTGHQGKSPGKVLGGSGRPMISGKSRREVLGQMQRYDRQRQQARGSAARMI